MNSAATYVEPVILVGAERSGTTLLRLMLDSHPQLAWANEFEFSVDPMPAGEGWPPLEDYYEFLSTHRVFQAAGYTIDRSLDYPKLVKSFLEQRRQRAGTSMVGATVHRHFDRLLRIWPNARFIHLVRDARDVARSCIGMGWAGNSWTGVKRWLHAEELWEELRDTLAADRRMEVVYEDLILRPKEVLTKLCEFIGIPYDARVLDYPSRSTYSPPDPSLIQQWQRKLSNREIRLVEARTAPMLVARGYELSGLPPLKVTTPMRVWLRLQDRWARFRYWSRVLGWRLEFAEVLSRRLGLKAWRRRVRLRINAIIRARLK